MWPAQAAGLIPGKPPVAFYECVGSIMIIFMAMLLNLGDFMSTLQHLYE